MKEKITNLVIFVLLVAVIIAIAGCSGAKVSTPPYSEAEIERQKIENEGNPRPGVRIATIRF